MLYTQKKVISNGNDYNKLIWSRLEFWVYNNIPTLIWVVYTEILVGRVEDIK